MFWKDETCWLTVPDGTIDTMENTPHERDSIDPFFWHRVRLFNDYSPVLNYSQRDIDWKGRAS